VPVLALAGEVDLRTPPADARAVVSRLPRGRLLLARGVGHAVLFTRSSACAGDAIGAWLAGRTPRAECPRPGAQVATVPRVARTFSGLAHGSGATARLKRTLVAVRATLAETRAAFRIALVQSRWGAHPVVLPGVLGGQLTVPLGAARVELTRYAYAPGVTLVGALAVVGDPANARLAGAVRVCGQSAARGVLAVGPTGVLRGVLAGRRVGGRGAVPATPACG
jgi:hypothetical protein